MGIKSLQDYLESQCSSACVSVDLLKIARGFVPKRRGRHGGSSRFCLVVDAESCLDRLYGGYYSDWVCGGQWNRMTAFLTNLVQACHNANMELIVFFNGGLETERLSDWFADQINQKKKVHSILRHLHNKGTPPPKVWWMPPVFLKGSLRMALRHLNVTVACSMDDHFQEVIGFCREHNLQGIIAQEPVYAIFDPPRYFSSNNLKLTYKGSLETKEYIMDEIAKCLDLNPNRFCVFAALLGNHVLPEEDMYDFFREQLNNCRGSDGKPLKISPENVILAVVTFVRQLPATDDLDIIGDLVFKNAKGNKNELILKFKQSVQYYLNGTHEGFLKYKPRPTVSTDGQLGGYPRPDVQQKSQDVGGYVNTLNPNAPDILSNNTNKNILNGLDDGLESRLAELSLTDNRNSHPSAGDASAPLMSTYNNISKSKKPTGPKLPTVTPEIIRIASERHQKGLMCSWIYQLLSQGELKLPVVLEDDTNRELPSYIDLYRPIRQTVYSVLFNLNKTKIIHETSDKEKGDGKCFDIPVKEWVIRRGTTRPSFELVIAKPVDWKTPSIERMWLGQNADDKNRRLRAFLTCMQSDSPLMFNTNYVPQPLLVMCCVLRYIVQFGRVLQRQELDAFLAMAVSPLLVDVQTMQDLKLPAIHPRGIQLASLFMSGVETAIFANDVCGAPIPWSMSCPWLFFDGKLFHFKLLKANNNTPLIDMCDGQVDQVLRVERMRQAILENIRAEFAKPLLPASMYNPYSQAPYQGYPPFPQGGPVNYRPAGAPRMPYGRGGYPHPLIGGQPGYSPSSPPQRSPGRGRGLLGRSPVDARGGQLEIAGVVVGSWGANVSGQRRGRSGGPSPQIMSVGGPRRGYLPNRPIRGRPSLYAARGYRPQYYEYYENQRGYDFYEGPPAPRGYPRMTRPVRRPAIKYRARAAKGKPAKHTPKGRGVTVDVSNDENGAAEDEGAATEDIVGITEDTIGVFSDADEATGAINKFSSEDTFDKPGEAAGAQFNDLA
ncbi:constitutive coactivator of PPAR-gamma-like protein 1 [Patella vulgata]|uniref:constitutive coactivator of PPAR-gamma-like protein 1 n=1 Tax=Patella vulgata TaxID=6465 RepID=UPI00217F62BB|nr:constitutive coactivator of PPAR-gamma-like protein 1 [Patella vulgata]